MHRKAINRKDVPRFDHCYLIDVTGTCNLKCPSCSVGSFLGSKRPKGFMSAKTFEKVRNKIISMHGKRAKISLYNWGEATLNPELPEILQLCYEAGLWTDISSNLNIHPRFDVEKLFDYPPSRITISTSGMRRENYEYSHRKGRLELFMKNFWHISDINRRRKSEVEVFVNFHLYKHNRKDVNLAVFNSEQAGFLFKPVPAFFLAYEKVIYGNYTDQDKEIIENMLLNVEEVLDLAKEMKETINPKDCKLRRDETVINYDSSVDLCCGLYEEPPIESNFLDDSVDFKSLQKKKYQSEICGPCMSKNMHLLCETKFHLAHINKSREAFQKLG